MTELELTRTQYLELEKLGLGAFSPVTGFMTEDEFHSVRKSMRLPDGQVFPLPIVLQTTADTAARIKGVSRVTLLFDGTEVGELSPVSIYRPDMAGAARDIYGTDERAHPGVRFFMDAGDVFVGGPVKLTERVRLDVTDWELTPEQTRSAFHERGWTTVAGFQPATFLTGATSIYSGSRSRYATGCSFSRWSARRRKATSRQRRSWPRTGP